MTVLAPETFAALAVVGLLLLVAWPLSQAVRHDDHAPAEAFLVFVAAAFLVAGVTFWLCLHIGAGLLPAPALEGARVALMVGVGAIAAGFMVGTWLVSRPSRSGQDDADPHRSPR
jgi:uncharacterized membrane protein (DUF485 family)